MGASFAERTEFLLVNGRLRLRARASLWSRSLEVSSVGEIDL